MAVFTRNGLALSCPPLSPAWGGEGAAGLPCGAGGALARAPVAESPYEFVPLCWGCRLVLVVSENCVKKYKPFLPTSRWESSPQPSSPAVGTRQGAWQEGAEGRATLPPASAEAQRSF